MSAYQWKFPQLYSVDAQTAGNELERIRSVHNGLTPEAVVDESRPEDAPLHPVFQWDDKEAAKKYRLIQAQQLIRSITIVVEHPGEQEPVAFRAYHHVQNDYKPLQVVVSSVDMMEELMESALKDLEAFEHKYHMLKELAPVFKAIESVKKCA